MNVFRLSNRWLTIDAVEAVRLAELERELKPRRTFEKQRETKPVKPAPAPKAVMAVERPRVMRGCRHCLRCRGMTMGGSVSQPRSRPRPGRRCPLTGARRTSRRKAATSVFDHSGHWATWTFAEKLLTLRLR